MERDNGIKNMELWDAVYRKILKLQSGKSTGSIDIAKEIEKIANNYIISAYKEGFNAAFESLKSANDLIQNK